MPSLVGSEMCIRDRGRGLAGSGSTRPASARDSWPGTILMTPSPVVRLGHHRRPGVVSPPAREDRPGHPVPAAERGAALATAQLDVLSLIHISEPTRLGMISYAVFC